MSTTDIFSEEDSVHLVDNAVSRAFGISYFSIPLKSLLLISYFTCAEVP